MLLRLAEENFSRLRSIVKNENLFAKSWSYFQLFQSANDGILNKICATVLQLFTAVKSGRKKFDNFDSGRKKFDNFDSGRGIVYKVKRKHWKEAEIGLQKSLIT